MERKANHLSKNTKLMELKLYYSNVEAFDFSNNLDLVSLVICVDKKLVKLDVSKNTKLTHLCVVETNVSSLDISKNTELTYLM